MELNTGDTAWVLAATALVLFMTPGLALFYGGMVRSKNVLGMLMQNFFAMGILAVLWCAVVFSLAFGNAGNGGLIGNLDFAWMNDVGPALPAADGFFGTLTIPFVLFCAFQMTFAIITPALITGATADRLKFSAYAVFISVWLVIVYCAGRPLGVRRRLARRAWARSTSPAARSCTSTPAPPRWRWSSCSACARATPSEPMPPHNLPLTMIGTGILWFGWAGFNAGSALAANGVAAQAIMNTFLAASAAMLGWLIVRAGARPATPRRSARRRVRSPDSVAITPCAGFVGGMAPIYIGLIAGVGLLPGPRASRRSSGSTTAST